MQNTQTAIPDTSWRRVLFDENPVACAVVGLDGCYCEVNDAYCAVTGYGRRELLARGWASITHPDDVGADAGGVEDIIAGRNESYQLDKRYITKRGNAVLGTLHVAGIYDDGQLVAFFSVFVPIVPETDTVRYFTDKRQVVYESNHVKTPWQWAARFPNQTTVIVLGLALLFGGRGVADLLISFFNK